MSKVLYEDGQYREPTQGDLILNQAINDFSNAVLNGDFFGAVKKLGVIEMFKTPDLPFFTGMAYQADKNLEKTIEYFTQVPETSKFYSPAMSGLATAYNLTGRYILLDELLKKHSFEISPIDELQSRMNCLEHMDLDDFLNSYDQLAGITSPVVEKLPESKEGQKSNYHICRMFADMLVVAGECMNRCGIYKDNVSDSGYDFESYPETALFAKMYRKCVYILGYSKFVQYIKFSNEIDSLAICAIADRPWKEKLKIFRGPSYVPQIVKIILELCRPEHHPSIPAYVSLENIMERYSHMAPIYVDGVIGAYFDVIADKAIEGVKSAKDYMGLSYSRILVTGKDPYKIKVKLDEFKANNPEFNFDTILGNTGLTYKMSRKGHAALLNAEYTFDVSSKGNFGVRDASGLALISFRVLEIEYNNKLILPFAKSLDFNDIKRITGFDKPAYKYNIDEGFSRWGKDLESLYDLNVSSKDSMEIGVIRTLIAHIWHRTDPCAKYLLQKLELFLTQKGKDALKTERMMDVIGSVNVNMYRNPGAHTGFVPYSKACDARDYVKAVLPEIEAWFIEQK